MDASDMVLKRHILVSIVVLVIASAMAGCSSDSDSADTTVAVSQGGNSGGESSAGDGGTAQGGNSGLPPSVVADFPIPIADGWVIDIQGEIGMTNASGVQLLYPNDDFDRLVAYYEQWTDSQASSYAKTEADELTIFANLESSGTITITPNHEERDQTWVHLLIINP